MTSRSGCGALAAVTAAAKHAVPCPTEGVRGGSPVLDDGEAIVNGRERPGKVSDAPSVALLRCGQPLRWTVWIPRVLWALERARREWRPASSAAGIARAY